MSGSSDRRVLGYVARSTLVEQDHRALVHVRRRVVLAGRCTQVLRTFNESRIEISAAVNLVRELDAHGALQGSHAVAITFFVGKPNGSVDRLIAFFLPFFHGTNSYLVLLWLNRAGTR